MKHEKHYNFKHEPIDVIEDWGLNFCLGNALKYIARCNHKGTKKEDIQKAINYLKRELSACTIEQTAQSNYCCICGREMPEGDQVCLRCKQRYHKEV